MLANVEETWNKIMSNEDKATFMHFEERNGIMDNDYEEY